MRKWLVAFMVLSGGGAGLQGAPAAQLVTGLDTSVHPLGGAIRQVVAGQARANPFRSTGLTRTNYLQLVRGYTRFMLPYQQPDGGLKDPTSGGSGYATPCFAACAATLVASGYDPDPALLQGAMKAVDWSLADLHRTLAVMRECDTQGRKRPGAVTDFYMVPLMLAYEQLATLVPADRYRQWTESLKTFDPAGYALYKTHGNNWPVVHGGGEFLRAAHGFTVLDYVEWILESQRLRITPFGMFMEGGAPFAYDGFSRYYLTLMLQRGYAGSHRDFYRQACWKGAWTALLCQSPFGEMPAGYRSSHHSWNEAQMAVVCEIYAAQYARAGHPAEAGAFKRGAHLALQCLERWVRPEGGPYVAKNRFPLKDNFKVANPYSTYSMLTGSMLCWAYLMADDAVAESPAPADVGGFAFHIPEFNMAFANAAGTYVQYMTRGNHHHNPTGLLRVHVRGGNPQLGPSDGAVDSDKDSGAIYSLSVGPAWMGPEGKEIRLAEFPRPVKYSPTELKPAEPPQAQIEVLSQSRDEVRFRAIVAWEGKGRVSESYVLNAQGLTVTDEILEPAVSSMRVYYPLLVTDGLEESVVTTGPGRLSTFLRDAGMRFEVLEPAGVSLTRSDRRIPQFNGLIEPVSAEIPARRATYRISAEPRGIPMAPDFTPEAIRDLARKVVAGGVLPPLPERTGKQGRDRALNLVDMIRRAGSLKPGAERSALLEQYNTLAREVEGMVGPDHLWRAGGKAAGRSVEAPDVFTSALCLYGLAWGVNQPVRMRWLDAHRLPVIRGWLALCRRIGPDGRVMPEGLPPGEERLAAAAIQLAADEVGRLAGDMLRPMPFVMSADYQRDLADQQRALASALAPDKARSLDVMRRACAWQQQHLFTGSSADAREADTCWFRGTFLAGVAAAYRATRDPYYRDLILKLGEKNQWRPGPNAARDGNDFAIVQGYLDLHALEPNPDWVKPGRKVMDQVMAGKDRMHWSWCDALFMAPPAFVRMSVATGDPRYRAWMHQQWWRTVELLFDHDAHLFYRDPNYLPDAEGLQMRERNGKKVFWGRGNGWVMGGLCRVLEVLPPDDPLRPRYEGLLRDMAAALLRSQGADGLWRASLLDPDSYPMGETSGSTFYCFGLAWGINHGVLDKAVYQPAAVKAWRALVACVEPEGKLGYSQQPADSPRSPVFRATNQEYATGAFLMAGSEMIQMMP